MSRKLSAIVVGILAGASLQASYADTSPVAPILHPKPSVLLAHKKTKSTAAVPKQMWNLQNADIRAVVQTIAQLTGKNFIVDPRVQGKVTLVSTKPMTVKEMYNTFLSMLQVLNYSAIPSGNIIKIVPSMDAKGYGGTLASPENPGKGDQVVVRVVPVDNVSAIQLVSILRPLMLDWGSVSAYQPSNSLVLAGSASNINQLVKIVHNLDKDNGSTAEVVKLKYADATKLAQVIQQLQSADSNQGKVSNVAVIADQQANTLLISGNNVNRAKTVKLIHQLDTPNTAGGNNTAVVKLNYLTAKKLAPLLTKLAHGYVEQARRKGSISRSTYGVGAEGGDSNSMISIQAVEDDNAIVMSGPHDVISNLEHIIKKIDVRPQEVLVQAIIVKINESNASKLGVQWGMVTPNSSGTVNAGDTILSNMISVGVGFIKDGDLGAIVTALANNGNTDILATPSVLVLNNQKADISDGQNVGIFNRQYSTNNNSNANDETQPYNTYDRKDVTLSLQVTPQIAPDNTVKLVIKQKDDSLSQDTQADSGNPTINTSKIDTSVLVDSGDILVLGGLISNNDVETDKKIPILGDIPLIGRLFHEKEHQAEKKNLMVFIRPVIINNKKEANKQSMKQYNYIRYQQMRAKDGLPLSNNDLHPVLPFQKSKDAPLLPPPFGN